MKNSLRGLKTKPLLLEPILNAFFVKLTLKARPVNCMKSLEDVYLGIPMYVYSMKIAVHGLLFTSRYALCVHCAM